MCCSVVVSCINGLKRATTFSKTSLRISEHRMRSLMSSITSYCTSTCSVLSKLSRGSIISGLAFLTRGYQKFNYFTVQIEKVRNLNHSQSLSCHLLSFVVCCGQQCYQTTIHLQLKFWVSVCQYLKQITSTFLRFL